MSKPMVTQGTFADFRLIKTRKLAQIIIEIPIEEADAALLMLGGLPRSDDERWVAIALLDEKSSIVSHKFNDTHDHTEILTRRAFCDLPFSQQAGIKSNDPKFQLWLVGLASESICATAIRNHCGVDSRAEILPGSPAGDQWLALLRSFEEQSGRAAINIGR